MAIDTSNSIDETKTGKDLYSYQKGAIDKIFTAFDDAPEDYLFEGDGACAKKVDSIAAEAEM